MKFEIKIYNILFLFFLYNIKTLTVTQWKPFPLYPVYLIEHEANLEVACLDAQCGAGLLHQGDHDTALPLQLRVVRLLLKLVCNHDNQTRSEQGYTTIWSRYFFMCFDVSEVHLINCFFNTVLV